jgi:hypothetical protein
VITKARNSRRVRKTNGAIQNSIQIDKLADGQRAYMKLQREPSTGKALCSRT